MRLISDFSANFKLFVRCCPNISNLEEEQKRFLRQIPKKFLPFVSDKMNGLKVYRAFRAKRVQPGRQEQPEHKAFKVYPAFKALKVLKEFKAQQEQQEQQERKVYKG
jgi:hypothetical protein